MSRSSLTLSGEPATTLGMPAHSAIAASSVKSSGRSHAPLMGGKDRSNPKPCGVAHEEPAAVDGAGDDAGRVRVLSVSAKGAGSAPRSASMAAMRQQRIVDEWPDAIMDQHLQTSAAARQCQARRCRDARRERNAPAVTAWLPRLRSASSSRWTARRPGRSPRAHNASAWRITAAADEPILLRAAGRLPARSCGGGHPTATLPVEALKCRRACADHSRSVFD